MSCWRSTIFRNRGDALFCERSAGRGPRVCVNRFSTRDIGPENGKITMFGGGYGEMSVKQNPRDLPHTVLYVGVQGFACLCGRYDVLPAEMRERLLRN